MDIVKILGKGAQGVVYLVEDSETKKQYIVKEYVHKKSAEREIKILNDISKVCEPYLTCIVEHFTKEVDGNTVFMIVLDYKPGMTELGGFIKNYENYNKLTNPDIYTIMQNLLKGLDVLHSQHIAHRDIKPENILLGTDPISISYIDYGSACKETDVKCLRKMTGTPLYIDPNIVRGGNSWPEIVASDIWSLGVVFMFICTGSTDFLRFYTKKCKSTSEFMIFIGSLEQKNVNVYVNDALSKNTRMFEPVILKMLKVNYRERMNAKELSNFLRSLYNPKSPKKLFLARDTVFQID